MTDPQPESQARGSLVAGVDGCRGGWIVVTLDEIGVPTDRTARIVPDASALLQVTTDCRVVVIDVPIGLMDVNGPGGREADRSARQLLLGKGSSVFPAPPRAVLEASSYVQAHRLAVENSRHRKGMSKQAFAIVAKIRDVDAVMTPERQSRIVEGHPELSFLALNGGKPLGGSKHTAAGLIQRMRLLEAAGLGPTLERTARAAGKGVKLDDILDATALAWTARRVANGAAVRIPSDPPVDGRGLRMEMWR